MKKSVIISIVIGVIIFIGARSSVGSYNSLIAMEEQVDAQWAQVENVYQRRMDLIPNLVNTVKGYASHEQETLTAVVEARAKATQTNINPQNMSQSSMEQFQGSQSALTSALSKLMVVVEKYPELKANQNFMELQSQLEGTENRISTERRRFNEICKGYNTAIRQFPTSIVAGFAGLQKKSYFEAETGAAKAPEVKF